MRVHTTSASAYIKLKGIARLRRDYGLADENDTGIPGVHQHLADIGKEAGGAFNARTALKRLDQIRDEIAFFFRAKTQTPTTGLDQARSRLQRERDEFADAIRYAHAQASNQLQLRRERFLEKMDPLFKTSVLAIRRATEGWGGVHWATLRAIVKNDGVFRSPSTGRSFDFNEDLAEPLLAQLPMSWEQYFTDDLGRVTSEFAIRLTESGKNFCSKVRLIIDLLFHRQADGIEAQLAWFQDKVSLQADASKGQVLAAVRERRSELAAKMPHVARGYMQPA